MQNLFAHASSYWVRYNQYEIKTGKNGRRYIMAAPAAEPKVYDPLKDSEKLVVDALNVGMLCMGRKVRRSLSRLYWNLFISMGCWG